MPATTALSSSTAATLPPGVRDILADRINKGTMELPVLPEVAGQVVTLSGDPTTDSRKLATLISRDQAMAGHLMRLANSPLYAPKTPLVSLDQVVSRMGMKKIRELALVISCQSKVFAVPGFEAQVKSWFRHSLAAAAFAQEIARSRRWNVEEAFLCGLLHDVGRPVLLQELLDLHAAAGVAVERVAVTKAISELHAEVGARLVTKWSLPVRLSDTIRHHHDPLASTTAAQTAMMTNLADDLAHLIIPLSVNPRVVSDAQVRAHPMLEPLNVYPDEMDALLAHREKITAMVAALG